MVAFRLPKAVDRAVETEAHRRDVAKQQVIEEAIRQYLGLADAA